MRATGRRLARPILDVRASHILEMQENIDLSKNYVIISKKNVLIAACVTWLMIGTIFYSIHDGFGWSVGLYQSVNIGWSIGWKMPFTPGLYNKFGSKLFSLYHNCIGVMFQGIAVIYIASELSANKDSWLTQIVKQEALEKAAETEGWLDDVVAFVTLYYGKTKVLQVTLVATVVGIVTTVSVIPAFTVSDGVEFIFATITGAGYMTIPDESHKWKFVACALFAAVCLPLLIVSLGIVMSFLFASPDEESVYNKILAPISPQEVAFMKKFGIDDGDGTLDIKEYIILTAVRIGGVTPELISTIGKRFRELDRRREQSIAYADIVSGYTSYVRTRSRDLSLFGLTMSSPVAPASVEAASTRESKGDPLSRVASCRRSHPSSVAPDPVDKLSSCKVTDMPMLSHQCKQDSECADGLVDIEDDYELVQQLLDNASSERVRSDSKCAVNHDSPFMEVAASTLDNNADVEGSVLTPPEVVPSAMSTADSKSWTGEDRSLDMVRPAESAGIAVTPTKPRKGRRAIGNRVSARTVQLNDKLDKATKLQSKLSYHRRRNDEDALDCKDKANALLALFAIRAYTVLQNPYMQAFLIWVAWLLSGTLFFSVHLGMSGLKGFFTSVSVGYGIYWEPIEERSSVVVIFASFHLLMGSVMIGLAMAAFANSLTTASADWYSEAHNKSKLQLASESEGYLDDILAAISYYGPRLKIHIIFALYTLMGIVYTCVRFKWTILDGWYFAWCCLSTGGFYPIAAVATDMDYFLVALYAALGAPIMAVTFGLLAHKLSSALEDSNLHGQVNSKIVMDELDMAKRVGIEDGDGRMDANEYAILILVRIGALSPDLIEVISSRFQLMDTEGTGSISYSALTAKHMEEFPAGNHPV